MRQQNTQAKSLNRILGADNSPSDLEKREQKESMEKKILLTKYDWLINYFYKPIKKTMKIAKDKIMSFLKQTKTIAKDYSGKNWENN